MCAPSWSCLPQARWYARHQVRYVELPRLNRCVIIGDGFQASRSRPIWATLIVSATTAGKTGAKAPRALVNNHMGHLIRLVRNKTAPDRISLWPEILAFIIKSWHPVHQRQDTQSTQACRSRQTWRAPVNCHRMALIVLICRAGIKQHAQQITTIIGRPRIRKFSAMSPMPLSATRYRLNCRLPQRTQTPKWRDHHLKALNLLPKSYGRDHRIVRTNAAYRHADKGRLTVACPRP